MRNLVVIDPKLKTNQQHNVHDVVADGVGHFASAYALFINDHIITDDVPFIVTDNYMKVRRQVNKTEEPNDCDCISYFLSEEHWNHPNEHILGLDLMGKLKNNIQVQLIPYNADLKELFDTYKHEIAHTPKRFIREENNTNVDHYLNLHTKKGEEYHKTCVHGVDYGDLDQDRAKEIFGKPYEKGDMAYVVSPLRVQYEEAMLKRIVGKDMDETYFDTLLRWYNRTIFNNFKPEAQEHTRECITKCA